MIIKEQKKYFHYKVRLLSILALFVLIILAYGYFIEPYAIFVKHITIADPKFSKILGDFKIVHLSDLHISKMGPKEEAVLRKINMLKPQIIFITGDIAQWSAQSEDAVRFLEQLKAPYGVFFVLGDADLTSGRGHCLFCHPKGNYHQLRQPQNFLRNEAIKIKGPKGVFFIGGVSPDLESDRQIASVVEKIVKKAGDSPLILLSHFPKTWEFVPDNSHTLLLSGDTHGGQVWMPAFVWKITGYKQVTDHTGIKGLFSKGDSAYLYINPGIGTTRHFPFRIGVPPRIALFEFGSYEK